MGGNIVVPELRVMLRPEVGVGPGAVDGFNFGLMKALQESLGMQLKALDLGKTQTGLNMVLSTDPENQFLLDVQQYNPAGFARTLQAAVAEPHSRLLERSFLADLNALRPESRQGLLEKLISLVSRQIIASLTVVNTPDEIVTKILSRYFARYCPFMLVDEPMGLGEAFPSLVAQFLNNSKALGLP